jgi:hypothetical protein
VFVLFALTSLSEHWSYLLIARRHAERGNPLTTVACDNFFAMPGLEIPGEFLRHAILDTVVPHAPTIDIEGALTSALEDGADDLPSVLSSIPQRSLLFFGMRELLSFSLRPNPGLLIVI